jgi:hypothetical protein
MPVAVSTAMTAASRRCWKPLPAQARCRRGSSSPVKTGTGLSGACGGFSPGHRVGDVLLGGEPLEELLKGAVLVAGVGWCGRPGEQEAGGEPLDCLDVGGDGLGGFALDGQMQPERADLRLEASRV